ncbi:MAG: aldo/keto reductase [Acidimicrobiia bacterium]|nr:aldo/keto reductase [Acidimicrobiia bacterium]
MNRRHFIQEASSALALLSCFPADLSAVVRSKNSAGLEQRSLGRTGEQLSILGFGGIVVKDATPKEASLRVGEAIDAGVNYFDVAPSYGNAEERLGPALEPYRKRVFVACKTTERGKAGAAAELEQSLRNLRTDHFDLYQLHGVTVLDEVEEILGPDGALQAFLEAKRAGKVRFLGFSAHSVEAAMGLMERFDFDTLLFPVNFATWHAGGFGPQVLAKAQSKRMGILALKAMAKGRLPQGAKKRYPKCWYEPLDVPAEAALGLRFTLSHPVTAAIPPGDENLFRMALTLAANFVPLTAQETFALKRQAMEVEPIFRYSEVGGPS